MIDLNAFREIIDTYQKYGWKLRRILIDGDSGEDMPGGLSEFSDVPISRSDIDAAWFSRPPKDGPVAWEIRYLGETPFALLERLDEQDPEFEHLILEVENRLCEAVAVKKAP